MGSNLYGSWCPCCIDKHNARSSRKRLRRRIRHSRWWRNIDSWNSIKTRNVLFWFFCLLICSYLNKKKITSWIANKLRCIANDVKWYVYCMSSYHIKHCSSGGVSLTNLGLSSHPPLKLAVCIRNCNMKKKFTIKIWNVLCHRMENLYPY